MSKELKASPTPAKPRKRWRKSESSSGITKSLEVEEVENGFIIAIEKYGRDETKKNSEYYNERRTYVSKTNPLAEQSPEEEEDFFSLKNIDATISDMLGGLAIS